MPTDDEWIANLERSKAQGRLSRDEIDALSVLKLATRRYQELGAWLAEQGLTEDQPATIRVVLEIAQRHTDYLRARERFSAAQRVSQKMRKAGLDWGAADP